MLGGKYQAIQNTLVLPGTFLTTELSLNSTKPSIRVVGL